MYKCVLWCVFVAGAGGRSLQRGEEAGHAVQVHAAHRLRHQGSSQVRVRLHPAPASGLSFHINL